MTGRARNDPSDLSFTLAGYRALLGAAFAAGYRFIGFPDVTRPADDLVCLLRHDCDNDLVAADRLSAIESERGVKATYFVMLRSAMYNLLAPPNLALFCSIVARGHHVGLHFDEHPFAGSPAEEVARQVDRERAILAEECGRPVDVVSFHQPSPRVLRNEIKLACLNTYDSRDMAGYFYASDSNMKFRNGSPLDLLRARRHRRLQLLIHPEWWTPEPHHVVGKWLEMLRNNFDLAQQSLLEREETYKTRHKISFRRAGGE